MLRIKIKENKTKNIQNVHRDFFDFRLSTFDLPRRRRGFTLLLAVVVSSLLLSIGIAIFNFTYKSLELSSLGRESQLAFFSADSGLECALYHDIKNAAFATSSVSSPPSSGVWCAEQDIANGWTISNTTPTFARTTFTLVFLPENYCAIVVVDKNSNGIATSTTIESRGYNSCNTSNIRRVERALRMTYE